MLQGTILGVLQLITAILPLVTGSQSADTVQMIDKIITAIEGLLPYIATWSQNIYTAAKNIIMTLQNSGSLTDDQKAATKAILAQVDAGWAAVVSQIDPDNPANKGTPAGDDASGA